MRVVTHLSQGGDAVRVRVQNTFGTTPLTVDRATAGLSGPGASVTGARPLTFRGLPAVTIPPGGEVWSDDTGLVTQPDTDVSVSLYVAGTVVPGQHESAFRENYLTPPGTGDHTADASGAAYTETVQSTYLVSAVDVRNRGLRGTIVAYGSSVVDGVGRLAVANAGISGTTSAAGCPGTPDRVKGLEALARLDRDVLALHGVTGVIYYYGTNDLAFGCTAEPILDSYRQVFGRLRDAGIAVYVAPITPRPGYTPRQNLDRHEVGTFTQRWNNCSNTCDGVAAFDQVLKDPLSPNGILPAYDHGDGVHANAAGQRALADFVSLPMLAGRG